MEDDNGTFSIHTPSIATPTPRAGINPILIQDIIEPDYPGGVDLILQRPGEIGFACPPIRIEKGCLLCFIGPEEAVHVRAAIKRTVDAIRASQQRQARNGI